MQENRKKSHGNNAKRDDTGKYLMGQNEPTGDKPKSTAAQIAEEVGVSESTVKRAEKFSKGIDVLQEVAPEAAESEREKYYVNLERSYNDNGNRQKGKRNAGYADCKAAE